MIRAPDSLFILLHHNQRVAVSRKLRTDAESPVYGDDRRPIIGFPG